MLWARYQTFNKWWRRWGVQGHHPERHWVRLLEELQRKRHKTTHKYHDEDENLHAARSVPTRNPEAAVRGDAPAGRSCGESSTCGGPSQGKVRASSKCRLLPVIRSRHPNTSATAAWYHCRQGKHYSPALDGTTPHSQREETARSVSAAAISLPRSADPSRPGSTLRVPQYKGPHPSPHGTDTVLRWPGATWCTHLSRRNGCANEKNPPTQDGQPITSCKDSVS